MRTRPQATGCSHCFRIPCSGFRNMVCLLRSGVCQVGWVPGHACILSYTSHIILAHHTHIYVYTSYISRHVYMPYIIQSIHQIHHMYTSHTYINTYTLFTHHSHISHNYKTVTITNFKDTLTWEAEAYVLCLYQLGLYMELHASQAAQGNPVSKTRIYGTRAVLVEGH